MAAEIFAVRREEVAFAWPEIEKHICRVENAPWSLADVRRELEAGRSQAWGIRDSGRVLGFWVISINTSWSSKFGLVWIAAGDAMDIGLPLYREFIEPYFRSQGCEWIDINGRKGWKRVLGDYSEISVVLRKTL